jgi:hypothetical protein
VTWRDASWAAWALIGAATVVLTALSVARRGGVRGPFAPLRTYLADHPVARTAAVVGWMWVGWHFFAR